MTEPTVNPEQTSSDAAEAPKSGRGRPRPDTTRQRDETVFAVVTAEPATKVELAEKLGMESSLVYLSLLRLRRDGRVQNLRNAAGKHAWQLADAAQPNTDPAPEPAPE